MTIMVLIILLKVLIQLLALDFALDSFYQQL